MQPRQIVKCLLLIWCWIATLSAPTALAANQPVLLPQTSFDYAISPYISIFEDQSNQLTIEQMVRREQQLLFTPSHARSLKFGITDSSFWLRFSVSNPYNEEQAVVFSLANSSFIDIKIFDISAHKEHKQISPNDPSRIISSGGVQSFVAVLEVPAKTTNSYLVNFKSTGLVTTYAHLLSRDAYIAKEQRFFTIQGFGVGLIFTVFAFFIYIWHTQKKLLALIGACYSITVIGCQPTAINYLVLMAELPLENIIYILTIFANLSTILYISAAATLNWEGSNGILIRNTLFALAGVHIPVTILALIFIPTTAMPVTSTLMIVTHTIAAIIVIFSRSRMVRTQRILRTGFIVSLIGILLALMTANNLLAFDLFAAWSSYILPMCALVFLTLATLSQLTRAHRYSPNTNLDLPLTPALISQISHELRTPINGVTGMTELLIDTPLSPQQLDFANTIGLAGRDLLHVANEISDLARIHAGNLGLEQKPVKISSLMNQVLSDLQQEAVRKQVELILDLRDDVPAHIKHDQQRLHTILRNILARALTYTEYGEMSVYVMPFNSTENHGIRFQIQLSSTIIRQEELRSAFQILQYQLPLPSDRPNNSWVMLLTRHLLKEVNGLLEVESMTSQGASLTLTLPISGDITPPAPVIDGVLAGRRILIVDDNASLRAVLERQVKRWGMKAQTSYSGKDALALLRTQCNFGEPFDLIIIDQDMPIMNGIQLTERIMNDKDITTKPARLMLTGSGVELVRAEATSAGVQSLLSKPTDTELLRVALLELLHFTPQS